MDHIFKIDMEKYPLHKENPDLVSVIIPVHNRFEMATRSIQSVLVQTYRPIQILVIDDHSNEEFQFSEPLQENEGIFFEIVRTDLNVGPGAAREIGRLKAKGGFIAYLDSDDMYKPEFLTKMVDYLKVNPKVDMAYCHAKYMSPEGHILEESAKKTDVEYKYILPYLITHGRPWHSSACIRRKSLTDKIGAWANLWFWEDYDYDTRAGLINNNIGYVPEVLSYIDKEHIVKITRNPESPKKNKSYGTAITQIARNIADSNFYKGDVENRIIYHLMKSSARNLDHQYYEVAQKSLQELLFWIKDHKKDYLIIHLSIILNHLKMGVLVSKILRRICQPYKY